MGQEITDSHFKPSDFEAFKERLHRETSLLADWLENGNFPESANVGGFELEAWLVDRELNPAGIIEPYLERLNDPLVVPELATFNLELNGDPCRLEGDALSRLHDDLAQTWKKCNGIAGELDARLAMVGILPTVQSGDLTMENMSPLHRYHALNEQVLRLRGGRPLELDIEGRDRLQLTKEDVMLESAATSFQIHLKVNAHEAGRFYNASKILSGPMVAISANSPYLFGHDLWDETRIPLFEQAVCVGGSDYSKRVTYGIRYVRDSIMECFEANRDRYPILLPRVMDEPLEALAHLRLQNGTIWRWNRPLIGFNDAGEPHVRIEHRVVPAGPTITDSMANTAFYYGAVCTLARQDVPPERLLGFEVARDNFYLGARQGLRAEMQWLDGKTLVASELVLKQLLPLARDGLQSLGIDKSEIDDWLGIIEARVSTGRNGAGWQRAWVAKYGLDMTALLEAYLQNQDSDRPVHEWQL
jgi:hypothetical protein